MTCSLQSYRIRIGTFQDGTHILKKKSQKWSPKSNKYLKRTSFILALIFSNYCLLALSLPALLQPHLTPQGTAWQQQHRPGSYTSSTACMGCPAPSLGTLRYNGSIITTTLSSTNSLSADNRQSEVWDPGNNLSPSSASRTCPWVTSSDRNKAAHITNGNTGQRGKGVTCLYWNKGPAFLSNKMLDISTIIEEHKPHILGLGEANF